MKKAKLKISVMQELEEHTRGLDLQTQERKK